jgi:hypothetical protein
MGIYRRISIMGVIIKNKEIRICKGCGKPFENNDFRQVYCNHKCQAKAIRNRRIHKQESPAINPDYIKLAQIAYDTVLQTMIEGEKEHGEEWKYKDIGYHKRHAMQHAEKAYTGDTSEKHVGNCMTRCAMIKYLEG